MVFVMFTGFDRGVLAGWFGIGDIVIFNPEFWLFGNFMRILMIELVRTLGLDPIEMWTPVGRRPNKRVAGYGANSDT